MRHSIHCLKHWLKDYSFEDFLDVARERPLGLKSNPDFLPLLREIRSLVPVDGDSWVKDIDVTIEPGRFDHQGQKLHRHTQWTAVFYVNPSSPIEIIEDGHSILLQPQPGDLVILEPLVDHRATANRSTEVRLSFAMLVEDPRVKSKFRVGPDRANPGAGGDAPPLSRGRQV